MTKSCKNWIDYWGQDDFWKDSQLWERNSELFFRYTKQIVAFKKDDSVLNIGCGSGHLEARLAPLVKTIHAVDVVEQFITLCKKRCSNFNNVEVGLLGDDYTDLSVCRRSFSIILCVSVVQYYSDLSEVEALINSARKVALPGARMLIADLPLKRGKIGFVWDALCSCFLGIREGYMWLLLRTFFARWLCSSHYKSFNDEKRPLDFTIRDIESLIQHMGLEAKIIRKNLSIYANRPSLLIYF
ncbi:class I SAM-dependent methyltransferase [bacterium]|nr:class I SAM-dependent methyltransferase [bacterium]